MKQRSLLVLLLGVLLALPTLTLSSAAHGQYKRARPAGQRTATPAAADRHAGLSVEIAPLFGERSIRRGAFVEILVRVHNTGQTPFKGQIEAFGAVQSWNDQHRGRVVAPLTVGAETSVSVRVPMMVGRSDGPLVRVLDSRGDIVSSKEFSPNHGHHTLLVNVSRSAALTAHLSGKGVPSGYESWSGDGAYGTSRTTAEVVTVQYDAVTGAPLLPQRAAGYARVAAVLVRGDDLSRLPAAETEALVGFVLGGGTLAVVVTRPEDLRHATLAAFTGGPLSSAEASPALRAPIVLGSVYFNTGSPAPRTVGITPPETVQPSAALAASLHGYRGGNTQPSSYGASTAYGLGELHVLGFDPNQAPGNDDRWVHVRMRDMLRRANERTSSVVVRHGEPSSRNDGIHEQLDPNRSARWAIAVATLLLIIYALVAGPGSYSHFRRRNQPLRAIFTLPLLSFGTFVMVFVLGLLAKGISGRARHLTMVDAGAGMSVGLARRNRVLFVPTARTVDIHATTSSSILVAQPDEQDLSPLDTVVIDHNGSHLSDVALHPWQAHLIREDDYASLGAGVAIVPDDAGDPVVLNRTGQSLLGAVLVHKGSGYFMRSLKDGARAELSDFRGVPMPGHVESWPSGMAYHPFAPHMLDDHFDEVDKELAATWQALIYAAEEPRDWFPDNVPVLLAELEGGEARERDTGLIIDQQRVLLRIVGWGGAP